MLTTVPLHALDVRFALTTDHAASSHDIPVLVDRDSNAAYGPADYVRAPWLRDRGLDDDLILAGTIVRNYARAWATDLTDAEYTFLRRYVGDDA